MKRYGGLAALVAAAALSCGSPTGRADSPTPQDGAGCPAELSGVMTVVGDGRDFLVCQEQPGAGYRWIPVAGPFPPNDKWLSYGPPITLHGQGFRNPNLASGDWTAVPQDSQASCAAKQVTVVSAGVLAEPEVSQSGPGRPLALEVLPKLFTVELTGDCLWVRSEPAFFGR